MLRSGLFLLESTFSGMFLWLGLYLVTRDTSIHEHHEQRWWQRSALAAGIAFICTAVYLLGIAMMIIVDDPEKVVFWSRLTWWSTPVAAAFFFRGLFLVTTREESSPRRRMMGQVVCLLLLAYAICIAIVGTTTNLFFQFDVVARILRPPYYLVVLPRFPFYALSIAMIIGALLAGTFLVFRRYSATEDAMRRQFQWLGLGAASVTLGATIGFAGVSFPRVDRYLPTELGDTLITVGLLTIGHSIARYNALLQNRTITRDFYRSLAGVVVTSIAFGLVFKGVHSLTGTSLTPESTPLLIWLATLTVTLRPWVGERLDEIFLPRAVVLVRGVLNRASEQLVTASDQQQAILDIEQQVPETITTKLLDLELRGLKSMIERDINNLFSKTNYKHNSYLSQHTQLLSLASVEGATTTLMEQDGVSPDIDRTPYRLRAFWTIIHHLVEDMHPDKESTDSTGDSYNLSTKDKQAHYIILSSQFIKQEHRDAVQKAVQSKLKMGFGGTYGRIQRSAKQRLAQRLYLTERKVREAQARQT